jgi:hypothetical protein
MSKFSIDIEKYYSELTEMKRQLKGIFCLQYPIFCIHSTIKDATPDPLDNLDKLIVDLIKIKPEFNPFQIGSIIGTSKTLVEMRISKMVNDGLLSKDNDIHSLTDLGESVFELKTQVRTHSQSFDFYVDGITLKPLPRIFYSQYKSKLVSENYSYIYTNKKGDEKIVRPFAPDIVHTPPEKNRIIDLIFAIDTDDREEFGIPQGLHSIDDISFTKMSYHVLVSVSQNKDKLFKELVDGYAIFSLNDELSYYNTLRKNVAFFEQNLIEKIQNLEFKIMVPFQKKDSNDKPIPYLSTNWPEIDRYKDSSANCFNFSNEDLINLLQSDTPYGFGLKEINQENITNDGKSIVINIRENNLLKSSNKQKLVIDLIRQRDYKIYNTSLERNVFLFYINYSTDDALVKELIKFIEKIKDYVRFPFSRFIQSYPEYTDKIRYFLLLAGEYDLLEKYDIENHMIKID